MKISPGSPTDPGLACLQRLHLSKDPYYSSLYWAVLCWNVHRQRQSSMQAPGTCLLFPVAMPCHKPHAGQFNQVNGADHVAVSITTSPGYVHAAQRARLLVCIQSSQQQPWFIDHFSVTKTHCKHNFCSIVQSKFENDAYPAFRAAWPNMRCYLFKVRLKMRPDSCHPAAEDSITRMLPAHCVKASMVPVHAAPQTALKAGPVLSRRCQIHRALAIFFVF